MTTATTNGYSRLLAAVVERAALHRAVDAGSPSTTANTTGCVRGLLCDDCNQIAGIFRDDSALVRSAAQYVGSGGSTDKDRFRDPGLILSVARVRYRRRL